jgi:hypothetical protein
MEKDTSSTDTKWSEMSNHLSGRLVVAFEDLAPGLRYTVYLELRNHGADTIVVTNQPLLVAALLDAAGNPVDTAATVGNGTKPLQQWAAIPNGAYIRFRVDQQGVGYPTKEHREVLLATGEKNWRLNTGQYLLKIKAIFNPLETGPDNQWIGELDLSPVTLTVTEEMFMH